MGWGFSRTVVSSGNAAALLAVAGSAGILLEVAAGDAALAVGGGTALVLTGHEDGIAGSVADTLGVNDASGGKGNEADKDGGERELHFEIGGSDVSETDEKIGNSYGKERRKRRISN